MSYCTITTKCIRIFFVHKCFEPVYACVYCKKKKRTAFKHMLWELIPWDEKCQCYILLLDCKKKKSI